MTPLKNYEGIYSITRTGRIWRHPRKALGAFGCLRRIRPGWVRLFVHKNGYLRAVLTNAEGRRKNHNLHRLVAEQFIAPIPGKDFVNHKNLKKTDCRARNLEWMTNKENLDHYRASLR